MGILTNLQRSIVPNIPILRQLIQWFDAVSERLDGDADFIAGASVDAGGTYFGNHPGFGTPIGHLSTGIYLLPFTSTQDTPNMISHVTLTAMTGPVANTFFVETDFPDANTVRVQIYRSAAGVVTRQDNSFYVSSWHLPAP